MIFFLYTLIHAQKVVYIQKFSLQRINDLTVIAAVSAAMKRSKKMLNLK